ncbi:MAG: hypothetical protein HFK02_00910 [Clostridia bacterium]|jgi:TM2 domain-containing membrane protein YozV|nr:hypothetical protein [Clostridia bacterium]
MAASKSDYFGLSYIVSLILAIIPVTSWICGAVTRFQEGKIVAGLLRLLLGWGIIWLIDLILMIVSKHIMRIIPV